MTSFWAGFEKQAGILGRIGTKFNAMQRLKRIREVSPDAFKPQNLLAQIIKSPSKGLANAAARKSATWNSPKEKALRVLGVGTIGATGGAYMLNKSNREDQA